MNVYKPLIIHNLLRSLRLLADGMGRAGPLVEGCRPDPERLAQWLEASLMRVTALAIGYERAAAIARHAHEKRADPARGGHRFRTGGRSRLQHLAGGSSGRGCRRRPGFPAGLVAEARVLGREPIPLPAPGSKNNDTPFALRRA